MNYIWDKLKYRFSYFIFEFNIFSLKSLNEYCLSKIKGFFKSLFEIVNAFLHFPK